MTSAEEEKRAKAGQRKLVVLNTANRVFCKVQQVINRDKYAQQMYTFYEISTGPNEYLNVMIGMPDQKDASRPHHNIMHRWSVQLLLDLAGNADTIIEQKVLQLMQSLFAAAHGVTDDE